MARVSGMNMYGKKVPRSISVDRRVARVPKPKIHACTWPGCTQRFSRKPDMFRHVRSTHEGIKDFECKICKHKFAQRTSLDSHERTHTGEKPWQCPVSDCGKCFGDQSSCARHYKEQHTGETHFCPHCSSTNKRPTEFKKHLADVHGVIVKDVSAYKFSENMSPDELALYPVFTAKSIEMRRQKSTTYKPSRKWAKWAAQRGMINPALDPNMISMASSPHLDSTSVTPSLVSGSVSSTPEPLGLAGLHDFSFSSASGMELDNALGLNNMDNDHKGLIQFSPQLSDGISPGTSYMSMTPPPYEPAVYDPYLQMQGQYAPQEPLDACKIQGYDHYDNFSNGNQNYWMTRALYDRHEPAPAAYVGSISHLGRSSEAQGSNSPWQAAGQY